MSEQKFKVGGIFTYEHIRDGKIIDTWKEPNIVTNEGLNYILDSALSSGAVISSWYIGVFKNNYTPVATDVASTFAGSGVASEVITQLTNTTRPIWNDAGAVTQTITNSASPAVFTFDGTASVYGAFLASSSVLGGLTGTLAAASKFSAVRNMIATDILNVTYTLSASSV